MKRRGRPVDPTLLAFARGLEARPGQWWPFPKPLTPRSADSYTRDIPAGKLRAFEANKFEAKRGGPGLLVRYVGGAQ